MENNAQNSSTPDAIPSASPWEKLLAQNEAKYSDSKYPKVTVIIPTYESSLLVSLTLESVLNQDYPDFEVLIIDAGSKDRTIQIVKSFRNNKIRIYTVPSYKRYEMLNKGISHSHGYYLNFLFPGDYYIYKGSLKNMMDLALDNNKPYLVYCGTLLRDARTDVKMMYRQLNLELLKRGMQPTSLQSCWFRIDTFWDLGNFDVSYELRGGFEYLCRFYLAGKYDFTSTSRILTDYNLRFVTRSMIAKHFWETLRTIWRYFGFKETITWLFRQKDFKRYILHSWRSIKITFFGQ